MLRDCLVVGGAFLCYMIADGATYSFGVLYVALLDEFHQSKAVTALVGALLMGLPQISAPLVCSYVGAFGPRVSAYTASIILFLAFFITRFAWTVEFLYFSVGLCASIGLELAYVSALVAIEQRFQSKLALATGITVSGSGIGMCIFSPLVDFLIHEYGWRGACTVLSGVCLNLAISASLFSSPKPASTSNREGFNAVSMEECSAQPGPAKQSDDDEIEVEAETETEAQAQSQSQSQSQSSCSKVIGDFSTAVAGICNKKIYTSRFMRFCLANFVVAASVLVPLTFLVHKAEVAGVEPQNAAILLSFAGLSSSAGQILLGFVAANWCRPIYVYVIALAVSGAAIVAMTLAFDFAFFAALSSVFGFTYGAYYALMSVMVVDYVSHELFTPALAIYALFQGVGDMVACPLVGFVFDVTNSYDSAFIVGGATLSLSIIAFLMPDIITSCRRRDELQEDIDARRVVRARTFTDA